MHEPRIVGEIDALRQLDGHVVDHLDVAARHIDRQIQVQLLDVLENVASIVVFGHGEMSTANLFSETVERSQDV